MLTSAAVCVLCHPGRGRSQPSSPVRSEAVSQGDGACFRIIGRRFDRGKYPTQWAKRNSHKQTRPLWGRWECPAAGTAGILWPVAAGITHEVTWVCPAVSVRATDWLILGERETRKGPLCFSVPHGSDWPALTQCGQIKVPIHSLPPVYSLATINPDSNPLYSWHWVLKLAFLGYLHLHFVLRVHK